MESEIASNQKEMETHEQENIIVEMKCVENDTSKSSMDSSFAVQDYNCSSFAENSDHQEASNSKENIVVKSITNGDGNDSGVEIGALSSMNGVLQRALSSNSGGYASSCGGLEDQIGQLSCNSSVISYCSETCEKTNSTVVVADFCASEGGSESSSITNGPTSRKSNSASKKKVAVKEPPTRSPRKSNEFTGRSRPASVSRSNTLPSKSVAPNLTPRERTRSRDTNMSKSESMQMTPKSSMSCLLTRSTMQSKRPPKPDSLPGSIKDSYRDLSLSSPRVHVSRTPSLTRGRTPLATPTNDDGRWPSISSKCNSASQRLMRATSTQPESLTIKTKIGNIHLDHKSSITVDKYATLPRRRKEKSQEDLKDKESRSSSTNRDRMTVSMIKRVPATKESKDLVTTPIKSYPKIAKKPILPKTKIYHETSVQTALTSKDLEDAFAGRAKEVKIDAVELKTKETQSDIRDKEYEKMESKIAKVNADYSQLLNKLTEKSQMVSSLEHQLLKEREEKLVAQKELQNNSERVMNMLDTFQNPGGEDNGGDSLLMLESQMLISGNVLEKQQEEISKLQRICRSLHRDMEKSLKVQANLICQKNELEEESTELQDFLQAEKVAFMEALKEAENEIQLQKNKIVAKDTELERQQEECRHLVRICEQRRQEYLGMQTKYNALENRSKDLLLSQGAAVSGASVALSGLGNRIEHLVDQLISSYNLSEQDLEDIVFYNEAYSNSCSSEDGSPEFETAKSKSSSDQIQTPQRGQSFLAAVISAIRNATSNNKQVQEKVELPNGEDESDSTEMLDSETEPCLMMDNVLEDVQMPDSHSHNQVSQVMLSQIEIPSEMLKSDTQNEDDQSLNDLSQAIQFRQQIELHTGAMATQSALRQQSDHSTSEDSAAEVPSIGDFCTAQSLVDQVIDVDNLVTKLLKVLRLIQLDNDSCIQGLVTDKNKIALSKDETLDKLKEWEEINLKLKEELKDTTEKLIIKSNELTGSKVEILRHRNEIDRLNVDICNLSTLCSEKNANMSADETNGVSKDQILNALKEWQETGNLPDVEIVTHVLSACHEIPTLKEKLREKEIQLSDMTNNISNSSLVMTNSWHKAINEAKRQYEAIDRALETLHSIQSIVKDCPQLGQLQRELEETNFQTASTIPLSSHGTADLNANETGNSTIVNSAA